MRHALLLVSVLTLTLWATYDRLGLRQQLGTMPGAEATPEA
jgi:hypothetical protein